MWRRLALLSVLVVAAFVAALSPAGAGVAGTQRAAKTCHTGYVHATFPWGQRCLRAGQYCKKIRNREYHRYGFQCVNGKLRKQTGLRKGK